MRCGAYLHARDDGSRSRGAGRCRGRGPHFPQPHAPVKTRAEHQVAQVDLAARGVEVEAHDGGGVAFVADAGVDAGFGPRAVVAVAGVDGAFLGADDE